MYPLVAGAAMVINHECVGPLQSGTIYVYIVLLLHSPYYMYLL